MLMLKCRSYFVHIPSYVPTPDAFRDYTKSTALPGFPESKYTGKHNDDRNRWDLSDKKFLTWDSRHGAVDLWNKTGKKHLGKYDLHTGNQLKDAKPERTAKP